MINDAKYNSYYDEVFAWTLAVIIISVLLEKLTRFLLNKIRGKEEKI
jgi:ABC-type nitrate/sulfonate/bicarbonate transport system permease component